MSAHADLGRRTTEPLLLVTVGSDHHPFDRVVDWVDNYLEATDSSDLRYVCQHGAGRLPRVVGEHQAFLEHGALLERLREATAVVCHGGPGTLVESLRSGRVPIAVPREQRYGEVVDDHQFAFCAFLAERGEIVLGDTEDKLHRALHHMLTEPGACAAPPLSYDADHGATVERFADMVGDCVPARRGWLLTEWRRHRAGSGDRSA